VNWLNNSPRTCPILLGKGSLNINYQTSQSDIYLGALIGLRNAVSNIWLQSSV
jgi:hypothetical protein